MPIDLRTKELAKLIVDHSVNVKRDENVIIAGGVEAQDFMIALYKEVILKGAHPILRVSLPGLSPFFYKHAKPHQIKKFPDHFDYMVKKAQKYIGIDTETNTKELSDCDPRNISERQKVVHPISNYICNSKPNMCRVTVGFPCQALAQEAEMSLVDYENFFYSACLQDWKKLGKQMNKIKSRFKENSEVHLIGGNVDLKMKVHGKLAVAGTGEENMPDGEIYMAPVRESLNGWIKFEYPAIRNGREVTGISLKFKDGKVIESKADKNEDFLKEMIATDKNSCYIGELGIGCNPKINRFTKDLLFDEKIGGTIHLALGEAYKDNGGGNDSALHWDIVKDMHKAKMIVDGKVIQKNGKWLI